MTRVRSECGEEKNIIMHHNKNDATNNLARSRKDADAGRIDER
jgi:hypothetical protein